MARALVICSRTTCITWYERTHTHNNKEEEELFGAPEIPRRTEMKLYYRRSCRNSLFIHSCADRHLEVFENANRVASPAAP